MSDNAPDRKRVQEGKGKDKQILNYPRVRTVFIPPTSFSVSQFSNQ